MEEEEFHKVMTLFKTTKDVMFRGDYVVMVFPGHTSEFMMNVHDDSIHYQRGTLNLRCMNRKDVSPDTVSDWLSMYWEKLSQ